MFCLPKPQKMGPILSIYHSYSCCLFLLIFLKVFIEFVTILLLFYVLLFWPRGMWDLSSPTGDHTRTPCIGRQSLHHWTAKEVPHAAYEWSFQGYLSFFSFRLNTTFFFQSHSKCHGSETFIAHWSLLDSGSWNRAWCPSHPETICVNESVLCSPASFHIYRVGTECECCDQCFSVLMCSSRCVQCKWAVSRTELLRIRAKASDTTQVYWYIWSDWLNFFKILLNLNFSHVRKNVTHSNTSPK